MHPATARRLQAHILSNYARDRRTRKRGGSLAQVPFDEAKLAPAHMLLAADHAHQLLALDEALRVLEQIDPRQSKVVECRFFGGMTVEETAVALGISPRTVQRDWAVAQAWLQREMEQLDE